MGKMGIKPAKVAHRLSWPTKAAKPGLFLETEDLCAKKSSLRGRTKVAKVGPPRARVKPAKVPPTPYVYYPGVAASNDITACPGSHTRALTMCSPYNALR